MAQDRPTIHELKPAKTIAQAVASAKAHVNNVNAAAGNASQGGAGATIISKGKGK
jgi:hypothetical protein